MRMEGFKVFKYFQSLRLHFTDPNYDVFQTLGRVKGSYKTYLARDDYSLYEKLGKRFNKDKECVLWIAANFLYNNPRMVFEQETGERVFQEYTRRKQSITKIFEDDLNTIIKNKIKYNKSLQSNMDVIKLWLGGKITAETLVILNSIDGIVTQVREKNPLFVNMFSNEFLRIEKSKRFVIYNSDRINRVYQQFIQEVNE